MWRVCHLWYRVTCCVSVAREWLQETNRLFDRIARAARARISCVPKSVLSPLLQPGTGVFIDWSVTSCTCSFVSFFP